MKSTSSLVLVVPLLFALPGGLLAQGTPPPILAECGALVDSGDLAPGEVRVYGFPAEVGDQILIFFETSGDSAFWLRWDLLGPTGLPLPFDGRFALAMPDIAGVQTIRIQNHGGTPNRLRFQLDWLAPESKHCGTRLECGSSVLGAVSCPFPKLYHFEADAGDIVNFSVSPLTNVGYGFSPYFYGPDGRVLSVYPNNAPFLLPMSGDYTILLADGLDAVLDDYTTFRIDLDWILPREKQCGERLGCDDLVSGELLSDYDNDLYFIEGNGGDKFHVELTADEGEVGFQPTLGMHDAQGRYLGLDRDGVLTLPSAGGYALRVTNSTVYVPRIGRYRLRLRKVWPPSESCAPVLECGVPLHGSTLSGGGAEFYLLDMEAGDRVLLDIAIEEGRDPTWSGNARWNGVAALHGPDFAALPVDLRYPFTCPGTGRYTLRIVDHDGLGLAPGSYTVTARWEEPASKRCDAVCPPPPSTACAGLTLRSIDFNSVAFRAAPSDPAVLAGGGREVEGAAADGVTPVLLVAEGLQGPGPVSFTLSDECALGSAASVGSLHDPLTGNAGNALVVQATQVPGSGAWKAFAVWTTPVDFSRGERDDQAAFRRLRVEAAAGAACGRKELLLVRPPVLLVHGFWGAGSTWDYRTLALQNGARYAVGGRTMPEYVYRHDYRLTNAAHLLTNITPLRRGVEGALRSFRGLDPVLDVPLACTQVDLVAHSMGAVISRLYCAGQGDPYQRAENYLRGDFHKFIALGGPHFGSPWADLADFVLNVPALGDAVAALFRGFGLCIDCGAAEDMQLSRLDSIPTARVPAHAVYGTGGSDYVRSGEIVPRRAFDDIVTRITSWLAALQHETALDLSVLLFGAEEHDMIVAESVARSGLPDSKVTELGGVHGIHTFLQKSWRVEARLRELLNARLGASDGPFAAVLPGGPSSLMFGSASASPGSSAFSLPSIGILEGALRIVSPMSPDGLRPGDAISVEVFPVPGFEPDWVLVLGGSEGIEFLEHPPFRTVVQIPSVAAGSHAFVAIGSGGHALAFSAQYTVRLDTSAVPDQVHVSPDPLFLLPCAPEAQLAVQAGYADFSLRDVGPGDAGLVFQSLDASIATVDQRGRVQARRDGRTSIVVGFNGRSREVPVIVDLVPADDQRALLVGRQCGANPSGLTASGSRGGRPVLGASVTLRLDPAELGYSQGVLFAYETGGYALVSGGQTLCVDASTRRLFLQPVTSTSPAMTFLVPSSATLVGRGFTVQGAVTSPLVPGAPPFQLTNALDGRIGAY